jgi:hypothetical protein
MALLVHPATTRERAQRIGPGEQRTRGGEKSMTLLIYYIVLVTVIGAGTVVAGLAIETVAPSVSMPIFLVMFFLSLWVAWVIAVKITEPKTRSVPIEGATSDQRA